jgi:TRAP-type C4-dicarboxylate transport system substrate-binding protein
MKFYEVMSQIVLTSHLVGFDLLTVANAVWDKMNAEQQGRFQAAADAAIEWSTAEHLKREVELVDFMKQQGLDLYTPDVAAFRTHVQQQYLESDLAKAWVPGMLDRINAL